MLGFLKRSQLTAYHFVRFDDGVKRSRHNAESHVHAFHIFTALAQQSPEAEIDVICVGAKDHCDALRRLDAGKYDVLDVWNKYALVHHQAAE